MPSWVSNEKKYWRSVDALKKTNQEVREKAIYALYVRYGGLVIGTPSFDAPKEEIKEDIKLNEEIKPKRKYTKRADR